MRFVPRLALATFMVLALSLSACDTTDPIPRIEDTWFAPSLDVNLAASTKTQSGLYYRDLEEGSGTEVAVGDSALVYYIGWFPNGARFTAHERPQAPDGFVVGAYPPQVIIGFEEGVFGMHEGGVRQLIIPPHLGFGSQPIRDRDTGEILIPGNSILVFQVEVVEVADVE